MSAKTATREVSYLNTATKELPGPGMYTGSMTTRAKGQAVVFGTS